MEVGLQTAAKVIASYEDQIEKAKADFTLKEAETNQLINKTQRMFQQID